MKNHLTAFATFAMGGALFVGCEGPSSGTMTPAGSPGTGTNVPMNNTPGLSGTGDMPPANRGTDTRLRVDEGIDAGVTGAGPKEAPYAPPRTQERVNEPARTPTQGGTNREIQPGMTPQPRTGEPTTRPPATPPLPRSGGPTTAPATQPSTR